MHIKVKITNFGKLRKTELVLKDLTFFAGTNNIGKSYVSRVLYSMFSLLAVDASRYYRDKHKLEHTNKDLAKQAYAEVIRDKLINNFQAQDLADLVGDDKEQDATVSVTSLSEGINAGDSMKLVISPAGEVKEMTVNLAEHQNYADVVYLESPLYWKLKTKLTLRSSYDILRGEQYLSEVPQYFLDLVEKINLRKIAKNGEAKFREELLDDLEHIIGGKIIRDANSEELLFKELADSGGSKNYKKGISLMLTATGIVQFAMLAYLIERRIIDRGTTLFLDEPETHLHPEWQELIMEALYQLSKHGVNVIIATHSPIIMQKLELCLKEDQEVADEKHPDKVALNYFSPSTAGSKQSYDSSRKKITKSLLGPASRMYVKLKWW